MNRTALTVLTSLLALTAPVACSSQAKAAPPSSTASSSRPDSAKVSAPVAVDAQLGEGQARVTVRFDSPATDVRVNVSGVDGLVVKSAPTPVDGASYVKEGGTTFDVTFTPGSGRSHLVVAVSGTFREGPRTKVASFAVGSPTTEQQKSGAPVITDGNGERIKVMPSNGQ
jgi:hypothetical protein